MNKKPNTKTNFYIIVASLLLVFTAVVVLFLTADTTSTAPETRRLFGLWRLKHFLIFLIILLFGSGSFAVSRGSEAFLGFVTAVGAILLVFGSLEGLGRAGIVSWTKILGKSSVASEAAGWATVPNQQMNGETFQDIATRVGLPSDPIHFEFSTDKYGFRNPSNVPGNIIVLGDSIVLGAQIEKSKTVDAVLGDLWERPVSQVALLGVSVQEQHELLLNSGVDLSNKTVVQFLFEGNDLLDSKSYRDRDLNTKNPTEPGSSSFVKTLWWLVAKASDPTSKWESADYCKIGQQRYLFLWTRRSFDGYLAEVPLIQQSIENFSKTVQAIGGKYFLVFVPTKYRVLNKLCDFPEGSLISEPDKHLSDLPETMRVWSVKSGIRYLDLTASLMKAASLGDIPWLWGDTHWAESGHEIAARSIADWRDLLDTIQN